MATLKIPGEGEPEPLVRMEGHLRIYVCKGDPIVVTRWQVLTTTLRIDFVDPDTDEVWFVFPHGLPELEVPRGLTH